jgi:hypothetical protein
LTRFNEKRIFIVVYSRIRDDLSENLIRLGSRIIGPTVIESGDFESYAWWGPAHASRHCRRFSNARAETLRAAIKSRIEAMEITMQIAALM